MFSSQSHLKSEMEKQVPLGCIFYNDIQLFGENTKFYAELHYQIIPPISSTILCPENIFVKTFLYHFQEFELHSLVVQRDVQSNCKFRNQTKNHK